MRFKVSLADSIHIKIANAAEQLSQAHIRAAQSAMRDLAVETYAKAQEMASQRLNSTRQKYADSLSFDQAGDNHWVITLDGDAKYLEEGYPSFNQIEAGLARGPKSKVSKAGHRYVVIPFEHKQAAAAKGHPMHDVAVQRGQAAETTKGNLAEDLKRLKKIFGIKNPIMGPGGQAVQGKAWSITKNEFGPQWSYSDAAGSQMTAAITGGRPIHKNLQGITGVQFQQKTRGGGERTKTAHMTWRIASENPNAKGKWIHPGFSGAKIFPDLEQWAASQLNMRLREIFDTV